MTTAELTWNGFTFMRSAETGSTLLYPAPTPALNGIEAEPDEGDLREVATVTGLKVSVSSQATSATELLNQQGLKGRLYASETRLAFCFTRFDTNVAIGVGSLAIVAGVANLVSAARKRDLTLLGHIRYPWLSSVGSATKVGWLSREALVLTAFEDLDDVRLLYEIDLTLDKRSDAAEIAEEILSTCEEQRGGRYEDFVARAGSHTNGEVTVWPLSHTASVGEMVVEAPDVAQRRRERQGLRVEAMGGDALAEGMIATLSLLDEGRPARLAREFASFRNDLRLALEPHVRDDDTAGHALMVTYVDATGERFLALVLTLQDRIVLCAKMGRQRHAFEVTEIGRDGITDVIVGKPDSDGVVEVEVIAEQRWRFEIDGDADCPLELKQRFLAALGASA